MAAGKKTDQRRRKSEETRRRIMQAGREVFTRKGYHDTRVSEIIDRTGLGHGTFWIYFRDKEDLLRALVQEMLEDFVTENLADRLTPENIDPSRLEDIEEVISRAVKVFEDNQPLHQAIVEAAMQSEEFAAIYDQINLELAEVYRRYLSFLLPGGGKTELDLQQISLLLVVTIAYNSLMWAKGFMHCSREDFVRNLSALLHSFINHGNAAAGDGAAN